MPSISEIIDCNLAGDVEVKLIQTIHTYDVEMFLWFMRRKHQHLFLFASRYISKSADGYLYIAAGIALWMLGFPADQLLVKCLLLGFAIERPLYLLLKNSIRRNRPEAALDDFRSFIIPSDRFSLPSGHTSAAFMVATLVTYFHPNLAPLLFPWAGCVGFARIFLGVHFPIDVLMGMIMGVGVAYLSLETLVL